MPEALDKDVLLTLGITAGALALFLWNRLRVDIVGLIVLAALVLAGLVQPDEVPSGFANEAVFTVAAMLVLSAGLMRTGLLESVASWMGRTARGSKVRLLLVMLAVVIPVSAFLNNTAAVAILLPVVLGLAREFDAAPSELLMPLSFGSQLGGILTLIGTSTNLLVAGLVLDLGLDRIGLFTITPAALVITGVGILYLVTVGRWLTPERAAPPRDLLSSYELREYLTGLIVEPASRLVGRSLGTTRFGQQYGLQVIAIQRADDREHIRFPSGRTVLHAGDLLLVTGKVADIARIEQSHGLRISGTRPELPLQAGEGRLAEVIVPPRSRVVGRTLQELDFRSRYRVTALAVQRHGVSLHERIGNVPLLPGDVLLVQGTTESLYILHRQGDLALLGPIHLPARRTGKRHLALGILAFVVLLPAFGVVPITVSSLLGALAMVLTGCLTPEEAYQGIDWSVVVLLGAILPLGLAIQRTGTAELLANSLLWLTTPLGVYGLLATVYVLTAILTEVISNNAAALVLTPIAVAAATALGLSPMPFVIAVMFAASTSFMTPIGYQTNTFIYGPGGYRFIDFLRVGGPLNLVLAMVTTLVLPIFFPFRP
ncbi:SLC13 family permease [Vulgatibacter sp.]|uniref:SLC13 family permease n=1 Tax=Vulgatibacter sp. TaxID=1971226 RepID=UPI00356A6648